MSREPFATGNGGSLALRHRITPALLLTGEKDFLCGESGENPVYCHGLEEWNLSHLPRHISLAAVGQNEKSGEPRGAHPVIIRELKGLIVQTVNRGKAGPQQPHPG